MTPAPSCCSGSSPPPTNAAPWASARTGPSTSGDGSCPSTPPPSACSTGCCTTASSSPPTASPTACAKPAPEEVTAPPSTDQPRGAGTLTWPPAGTPAWPLTLVPQSWQCDDADVLGSGRRHAAGLEPPSARLFGCSKIRRELMSKYAAQPPHALGVRLP